MYLCTEALYYQVYSLTLRTNLPLPILIPTSTSTTVDVEVNLVEGELSARSHRDQQYHFGWYTQQKADGIYYCLSLGGSKEKLDVEIAPNGKQIWINWANVPLAEVTAILLGCIIGTALRLQGKICLHSSVIKVDNCAISIIGAKGAGKSTTAAAFAKRGYPILADDIAVLADCGDSFLVQPGYPRLRLWKSAVNAVYGSEVELPRVFRQTDKHFVQLNQNGAEEWRFHSKPLPLAGIYMLGERQPTLNAPSIEPISPQMGLMHLLTHKYPESLKLDKDRQRREFADLGRLVKMVPIRQINRSDSLNALPQLCDAILEDVACVMKW
ncbi:MAG: serine/threonine protein kinase [Rivularia sp. (in: cyanobacteria)]